MDHEDLNQELIYPPVPLNGRYLKNGKLKPDLALPRPDDSANKYGDCRWVAPIEGWFQMDCDASFIVDKKGSIGIIFRDFRGRPIAVVYGVCNEVISLYHELQAIRHGLLIAKENGISPLCISTDNRDAYKLIKFQTVFQPSKDYTPEVQVVVDQIKTLLQDHFFDQYELFSVYRQENFVADHLSKAGMVPGRFYYCPSHFTVFNTIPGLYDAQPFDETLYYFINRDANGPSFTRYNKDYIHPMDRGEAGGS
ncbi:hypothetical protein BVC80_355g1 [Macleaya cordata]|uniref:RNase H type-1 domain-containing protein n=1 Tax=Macleaya cordata TaxID=56857 RepID=A0A200QKN2_MACCD|nr:hypothetical protein BVC80_355g1 [Macleaya cordata]